MLYIIYLHYFSKGIKYRFTYLTLMCNIVNYFYYLKYKNSNPHLTAEVGAEHI